MRQAEHSLVSVYASISALLFEHLSDAVSPSRELASSSEVN